METPEQLIQRVVREEVAIAMCDPGWLECFRQEKEHLLSCLPRDLIRRVEHFGSTAVPGLAAKPIVDVLVEVSDLQATPSGCRMSGPVTRLFRLVKLSPGVRIRSQRRRHAQGQGFPPHSTGDEGCR
jgi:hypothetical protein